MISYLQAEDISFHYGEILLFDHINININKGDKTALIAKNGTGKTTLLNILSGSEVSETGKISAKNDISIGYLEQYPALNEENTVIDEIFSTKDEVIQTIRSYEVAVEKNDTEQLTKLVDKIDRLNAWDFESRIKQILTRFKINNYDQKISTLSGGQKKRLALAAFLISEPDVMIMDEPTNHLDLDMIEWLEEYLSGSSITLFMVTHDRYFLDRVCNEIIELDQAAVHSYKGNYSYYLEKREERLATEQQNTTKAKSLMKKELEWMRRMPKARSTKAKYRVDAFDKLKEKASQHRDESEVNLNVEAKRLGKKILEISGLSKSYGELKLIDHFSYKFTRFEKVGIVGENGTGKTTFLNLITRKIKADTGDIDTGETITFGYYRQEGLSFNPGDKVIDVARNIAEIVHTGKNQTMTVSQFLNYFLFPPETQNMRIDKLSGGEKRRLYLMTILMKNPNFLILDEPTNDLDILTLNILEDYLLNFAGCVIVVSHDRYFMDKIVDHLFVFKGNGVIRDFPGNYTQYRNEVKEKEARQTQATIAKKVQEKPQKNKSKERPRKLSYNEKREFEMLGDEIEKMEKEKAELEKKISEATTDHEQLMKDSQALQKLMENLDNKTNRWLELAEIDE
jgi:ATP-binding cassette subfamily F protein uup